MFGWFSARCPLDTWEMTWTEMRMRWLADQFGLDRLRTAEVILPTDDYFPDPYQGTTREVRRLMRRLCGFMDIEPDSVELEICEDLQLPEAAGHYDASGRRPVVRVAQSQLADPQRPPLPRQEPGLPLSPRNHSCATVPAVRGRDGDPAAQRGTVGSAGHAVGDPRAGRGRSGAGRAADGLPVGDRSGASRRGGA